jgi:hypothetical protein
MKNTTRSVGLGCLIEFWLMGMEGLGLIEVVGPERKHMETVEPFYSGRMKETMINLFSLFSEFWCLNLKEGGFVCVCVIHWCCQLLIFVTVCVEHW